MKELSPEARDALNAIVNDAMVKICEIAVADRDDVMFHDMTLAASSFFFGAAASRTVDPRLFIDLYSPVVSQGAFKTAETMRAQISTVVLRDLIAAEKLRRGRDTA